MTWGDIQRIFFSSGLKPQDFWDSTFDEVLLVVKGKVDDWRIQRMTSYQICCSFVSSDKMPHICDFMPLAFDEEIRDGEKTSIDNAYDEYYHRWALEQMQSIEWPSKN